MNALDCLLRLSNLKIIDYDLRYCLVDNLKNPFQLNGDRAKTNDYSNFVKFEELVNCDMLEKYSALGISVQASNIIGIDIDHCVDKVNDINSINNKAKDIIDMFKDFSYIEFSFSGKGIRILFKDNLIKDYENRFYIKNSNQGIEFYQHDYDGRISNRYLTITGNCLYDNLNTKTSHNQTILTFLNKYMQKQKTPLKQRNTLNLNDNSNLEEAIKKLEYWYKKDFQFCNDYLYDSPHPLDKNNSDESERDYRIIDFIYTHITRDRNMVKQLFEMSRFFKTKDDKHMKKWNYNNFRYYNWQFDHIKMKYGD